MMTLTANHLALTPLSAGDLIDRTVRLYRRHFETLIRTAAPPAVVSAIGSVLWTIGVREVPRTKSGVWLTVYFALVAVGATLLIGGSLLYVIVMGGATRNLVRHLVWDEPVSARAIFQSVRARFWGLLGATVALGCCVAFAASLTFFVWFIAVAIVTTGAFATARLFPVWLAAMMGVIAVVSVSLGALWVFLKTAGRVVYIPQVMMVEDRGLLDAVTRSVKLSRNNVRRLAGILLFTTFATYSALMLLLVPLGWYAYLQGLNPFIEGAAGWPAWYAVGNQVVTQLSSILLAPVWMLGLSLLYVDERVRHEGFDIELLATQVFGSVHQLYNQDGAFRADSVISEQGSGRTDKSESRSSHSVLGL
ncbi:MAG: hypothetical protein H0T92_02625 [Pyrinomonadaceae bacterium]|nr:hypothetical protein [Pyrinomonadaceae bacterium]